MPKRNDPYSRRRFEQRISADADQTEIAAIKNSTELLDAGVQDDRLAGAMDDFSVENLGAMPHWQEIDLENETASSEVVEEILRRNSLLGSAYPFRIEKSRLIYEPTDTNYYEYFLSITQANSLVKGKYVILPRIFERITANICSGMLGAGVKVLHTGAPRDGNPQPSFKATMERLETQSGEWTWGPRPHLPSDGPPTGDEGLDFVAWKRSPDQRYVGQLFLIGQCACGGDWETKWQDLSVTKLQKWFNPFPFVPPVRMFITPFVLSQGLLIAASEQAGLVFDRLRLTSAAADSLFHFDPTPWNDQIKECIELVLNEYP